MDMPVRRAQLVDPTQNDEVVASVVFGPDVAVKPHQGVFDDGVACLGGSPGYAGPLVDAFPGELVRNGVLVVGEDGLESIVVSGVLSSNATTSSGAPSFSLALL